MKVQKQKKKTLFLSSVNEMFCFVLELCYFYIIQTYIYVPNIYVNIINFGYTYVYIGIFEKGYVIEKETKVLVHEWQMKKKKSKSFPLTFSVI